MIFFIGIVFIAELIIATTLVVGILYCDGKVTEFNNKVLENRYKIKLTSDEIKKTINDFFTFIKTYSNELIEKERLFITNMIKKMIFGLILMILAKKYKKQVLLVELVMILHETYKKTLENSLVK